MKEIELKGGKKTFVDDEDFEVVKNKKWFLSANGYAVGNFNEKKQVSLHRFLLSSFQKGKCIDHIDGNKLNNSRGNLRFCSIAENSRNRKKRQNFSSSFKGVYWSKKQKKWIAQITFKYKGIRLGSFREEKEAALKYDEKARELFGAFASTNF